MKKTRSTHKWEFAARFRRNAFGWKSSQLAARRVKEAVSEIAATARRKPLLAAEGAVRFLERVSPALERVDSSSGAMGSTVNRAITALVPIIAGAAADRSAHEALLERLWAAHEADQIPYIETLADYWGELCVTQELASAWADRLLPITRLALHRDENIRGHFHGTTACLSSLFRAERFAEIVELLEAETFWPYKRWAVKALTAMGNKAEAVRYAEACRGPWTSDIDVDELCEGILLSSGLIEEAYRRYGLSANRRATYAATFRAVAAKYPQKPPLVILGDLVETTPGEEGKWFAAAKDAGFYAEALALAARSPCDPRTLARAARDHAERHPDFAHGAGMLALSWLARGYGYEITSADVRAAYTSTINAAERLGTVELTRACIRDLVADKGSHPFLEAILGGELGLQGGR